MIYNMEQIVKKDGKVYLKRTMDGFGRHTTWVYLGLDPDLMEKPIEEEKPKTKAIKKEGNI